MVCQQQSTTKSIDVVTVDRIGVPSDSVSIDITKDIVKDDVIRTSPEEFHLSEQDRPSLELQWDLSLTVSTGDSSKKILDHAVGIARPGEVLAIMGPSGAGKTSLLNCISGRNTSHDGHVTLITPDGRQQPWSTAMKRITSYVQQDDMILPTITPREHLQFQAALQMDQTLSQDEIDAAVEMVLAQLNLTKCADTLVGDPALIRGISGGERKRLSFAAQLLCDPAILFVDEPTSGLDSHMAEEVVRILSQLASSGGRPRTVITTIHQPTSHAFSAFDQLLLLRDGRGVYLGPANEAAAHFGRFGEELSCPKHMNPSDFFLHVLGVDSYKPKVDQLCDAYNTKWAVCRTEPEQRVCEEENSQEYTASNCKQFKMLMWREWVARVRNPHETHSMITMTVFFAVLMGLCYFQLGNTQKAVQSRNGVLFMSLIQMAMQLMTPTIMVFAANLPMHMKEHKEGQYSTTTMFVSKVLGDTPFQAVVPVLFGAAVYFMIGLPANAGTFFRFVAVLALTATSASGLGYLLGCAAPNASVANLGMPMVLIPNMLLSGFMISLDDIPVFLRPFSYATFVKYAISAQYANIWTSEDYNVIGCSAQEQAADQCLYASGNDVLAYMSIDADGFEFNMLMLAVLSVVFRILAYIALRLKARNYKTVDS